MLHPEMTNFGLSGLEKWADLVANPKDKKGWPAVFSKDADLYKALTQVYYWLELFGTGGGAARPMFARCLDEASVILRVPRLKRCADRYRALGAKWTDLTDFARPVDKPTDLMKRKQKLFRERGGAVVKDLEAIEAELRSLPSQMDVTEGRSRLPELEKRLRHIAAEERDAIEDLKGALQA
jgi:hypothetical protein